MPCGCWPNPAPAAVAKPATRRYTTPRAPNPIRAITVKAVCRELGSVWAGWWGMMDKRAKPMQVLSRRAMRSPCWAAPRWPVPKLGFSIDSDRVSDGRYWIMTAWWWFIPINRLRSYIRAHAWRRSLQHRMAVSRLLGATNAANSGFAGDAAGLHACRSSSYNPQSRQWEKQCLR